MSDKEVSRIFSGNLRRFMAKNHINQKELANRLGVSESSVSNWLHETNTPRTGMLNKLANIFECEPSDLLADVCAQAPASYHDNNIRMIARAAERADLSEDQTAEVLRYMRYLYPGAFGNDK